ncbi:ACY1-like metalloprotease [Hyaloraphidium curvatum]|nr:ACY1-like metalloprotease [Hyaloraphidium curvatum]
MALTAAEQQRLVDEFVAVVRFPTVSGTGPLDGSYDACGGWLLARLTELGADALILPESKPHKPIVVGTLKGTEPALPALLLNSHYDVVPVIEDKWTVPAFEGFKRDGRIYGRGTQDMKCVCVQYLAALRHLLAAGPLRRTIHISYVPDEEVGGADGMGVLMSSAWFKSVGELALALDEGLASEGDAYPVFYGERNPWWVRFKADGNTGHGSRFIEGTAVEQVVGIANRALAFRAEQRALLHPHGEAGCSHAAAKQLGDVTTLNLTVLRAGTQAGGNDVLNVVPAAAEAAFDVRIPPHTPMADIGKMLDEWCAEVKASTPGLPEGGGVRWEFVYPPLHEHATTSTDEGNPWWGIFSAAVGRSGAGVVPSVFPAATDSRFLRAKGVRAFGFSPMRNSPVLLHEHDEFLAEAVLLEGAEVYVEVIRTLASQGPV